MREILIVSLGMALSVCTIAAFILIGVDFLDNFRVEEWGSIRSAAFASFIIGFFIVMFDMWMNERRYK